MKTNLLSAIHPGKILQEEFMIPLKISINRLARDIGVPPELWMGLQADYELRIARRTTWPEVEKQVRPFAA